MKFETLRTIFILIIILLTGIWLYKSFSGSLGKDETLSTTSGTAANQIGHAFNFKSHEEVKVFIRKEEAKPLPQDYIIPEYITTGQELDDVFK
jgi:hypothetical protein